MGLLRRRLGLQIRGSGRADRRLIRLRGTTVFGRGKWVSRPFKATGRRSYARPPVTSLRPRFLLTLLGLPALLFAGASQGAPSQDAPATPVPLAGVNLPKTYAQGLTLSLAIPGDYRESGYRQWSGPTWHDPNKPSVNGIAGIQWLVRLDSENGSAEAAATDILSSTAKYSRFVSRGPAGVPHVGQNGRSLGSIPGFAVIVQSADPKANAQYQGAVAFRLARPTPMKPSAKKKAPFVVIRFKLELPGVDRGQLEGAELGDQVVVDDRLVALPRRALERRRPRPRPGIPHSRGVPERPPRSLPRRRRPGRFGGSRSESYPRAMGSPWERC